MWITGEQMFSQERGGGRQGEGSERSPLNHTRKGLEDKFVPIRTWLRKQAIDNIYEVEKYFGY